jgi:hypothetical protein
MTWLVVAMPLDAQQLGTVAGRVLDSATTAPRPGALATIVGLNQTARSDRDGRFILSRVPAGERTLRLQSLGAGTVARQIVVRAGETTFVDVAIGRDPVMLDAVRSDAPLAEHQAFMSTPNVGSVIVTARAMEALPRLGEIDLVRVVQFLPGVQAKNDFTTGFNVRGGESDQNLILIDGYPIYNPFHLGGLFSTFIAPTVRDIQMLTGAFPARFGGRLSSVLDVRSAQDERPGIHGTADISVLASTASLSGALPNDKGSWLVAGRRTYADQAVKLVSDERLPYHFRDEQAHVTYKLSPKTRLSVSLYDGRDILDGTFAQLADSANQGADGGAFFFSWGNLVAGATLSRSLGAIGRFGDSALVEQRASTSKFSTRLDLGSGSASFENALRDVRLAGSFSTFGRKHDRTIGYDVSAYAIDYTITSGQGSTATDHTTQRPTAAAIYYDELWRVSPSLLVSMGARAETFTGQAWAAVSPRFAAKYLTSRTSAFTVATGRFSQWLHSMSLEDSPVRLFDLWRASDHGAPVSSAWHLTAGHERWLGASRFMRLEAFHKRYDRLLEFNVQDDSRVEGDEFVGVAGTSYGADFLLRQLETGRFAGWLAYTYTMNTRNRDGVRYAPAQDRRHDLNVVATYRFGKFVTGARLGYASGMPYTDIVASTPRRHWDPVTSTWGGGGRRAWFDDIGSDRNGARLPPTRRFDVFAERSFAWRGATVTPSVSVVNAANARNVLFYVYDFSTAPATRRTISQLPIVPSAGVAIAF